MSLNHLLSGVRYLAFQHVFFWYRKRSKENGSHNDLWPTATYWDMSKQAAKQSDKIKQCWDNAVKELGMISHKISLITIFGHFGLKFHQKFDIFH